MEIVPEKLTISAMSSHHSPPPSSSSHSLPELGYRPISHRIPPLTPPIHAGSNTSSSSVTRTPEEEAKRQSLKDDLYDIIMGGDWDGVLYIYSQYKEIIQTAKVSSFNETALHLAISDSRTDVVEKLLKIIDPHVIRNMTDHKKENPLHLAASLGQTDTCKLFVDKDPELIGAQDIDGETPLFAAARHGKKGAFYALHPKCPITGSYIKHEICHCKRKDGDTILHVSILGEYFGLIVDFAKFETPSDFQEGHRPNITSVIVGIYKFCLDSLTRWTMVINAIVNRAWEGKAITSNKDVEKQQFPVQSTSEDRRQAMRDPNPDDEVEGSEVDCHRDHINAFDLLDRIWKFGVYVGIPNQSASWTFFRCFLQFAIELLLSVLGLGFFNVNNIRKRKQKHTHAAQVMEMLVCYATDADSGSKPPTFDSNLIDPTCLPTLDLVTEMDHHQNALQSSEGERENKAIELMTKTMGKLDDLITRMTESQEKILTLWTKSQQKGTDGKETGYMVKSLMNTKNSNLLEEGVKESTPFLIAAKMGVFEIVRGIMKHYPMAIHQEDADNKNAVLLVVEHKHPRTCQLLLEKYSSHQSLFQKVDKNGNSAFHLAATTTGDHPWRIHGTALQIQWELKWFNVCKTSMEVFQEAHREMVKEGVQWLINTSQSCSDVAALIASVAYASATTVPGGLKEGTGVPLLRGQPAFNIFTISSLIALCLSVTSLTMFLSILTSRYQTSDFLFNLPMKLILGLSSLLVSIAAMLVSFSAGHFFDLEEQMRRTAFPIYAITCLPVSFYALTQFRLYIDLIKSIIPNVPQRSHDKSTI